MGSLCEKRETAGSNSNLVMQPNYKQLRLLQPPEVLSNQRKRSPSTTSNNFGQEPHETTARKHPSEIVILSRKAARPLAGFSSMGRAFGFLIAGLHRMSEPVIAMSTRPELRKPAR